MIPDADLIQWSTGTDGSQTAESWQDMGEMAREILVLREIVATVSSATVDRGLKLLRSHFVEGGHNWAEGTDMADVEAACEWIAWL